MRTEPSNLLRQPSLQNVGVWSMLHSDRCTAGLTTECGHVQKNSLGVPPLNFFSSSSFILFSKWLIERKRLLTFLWLLFLIGHYNNLLVVELVSDFNVRLLDAFIICLFFLPCYGLRGWITGTHEGCKFTSFGGFFFIFF